MKSFLNAASKRQGYDGWALKALDGSGSILPWSASTTRAEARALKTERQKDFFHKTKVVKVTVTVSEVSSAQR